LGVLSLMAYGARRDASNLELVLIAALSLLPVSELAISLVNALLTAQIPPRRLPKLSMRGGIPAEDRTLVAVPAIIDSPGHLETLLHELEVRFLGNRDDCLHFVLLADFADAIEPETQNDARLVELAEQRIGELNAEHGADRFFCLHRRRVFNAV